MNFFKRKEVESLGNILRKQVRQETRQDMKTEKINNAVRLQYFGVKKFSFIKGVLQF